METMSKRLIKFRKAKQLTQKQVAEFICVPATTYRDWEYGREIQGEPYYKLTELFEISLSELMGVDISKTRSNFLIKLRQLKQQIEDIEKDILSIF